METNEKNGVSGLQKELGKEISQMEEEIQELPEIKKDIKKTFLILVITVVIAVLMRNVLGLNGWWLYVISTLNVVSLIATVILVIVCTKWFRLEGFKEIIEKAKERQKK